MGTLLSDGELAALAQRLGGDEEARTAVIVLGCANRAAYLLSNPDAAPVGRPNLDVEPEALTRTISCEQWLRDVEASCRADGADFLGYSHYRYWLSDRARRADQRRRTGAQLHLGEVVPIEAIPSERKAPDDTTWFGEDVDLPAGWDEEGEDSSP